MEVGRWCYDSNFQRIQIYYLIKHIGHSYGNQLAGGWMLILPLFKAWTMSKNKLILIVLSPMIWVFVLKD